MRLELAALGIPEAAGFRRLWQPAMPLAALEAGPQPLMLHGRELVLWRGASGTVAALADHCPHQGVRLSTGWVEGERLVCPWHRWRFGADGVPAGVAAACARPFPVRAQEGMAWVALEPPLGEPPATGLGGLPVVFHGRRRLGALALGAHAAGLGVPAGALGPVREMPGGLWRRVPGGGALRWWPQGLVLEGPDGRAVAGVLLAPLALRWSLVTVFGRAVPGEAEGPEPFPAAAVAAVLRQRADEDQPG